MKIRPVGAELFHADGQTDESKLILAFRNFANSPTQLMVTQHAKKITVKELCCW